MATGNITGAGYQRAALRTLPEKVKPIQGKDALMVNLIFGLEGEFGEMIDQFKKQIFHGHHLDRLHLQEELGDVLWYLVNIATVHNLSLMEIMADNVAKLQRRYPDGFSQEASQNRDTTAETAARLDRAMERGDETRDFQQGKFPPRLPGSPGSSAKIKDD
jgi:NTP pyrophosphatase (non-canonical NTP hydrolase)